MLLVSSTGSSQDKFWAHNSCINILATITIGDSHPNGSNMLAILDRIPLFVMVMLPGAGLEYTLNSSNSGDHLTPRTRMQLVSSRFRELFNSLCMGGISFNISTLLDVHFLKLKPPRFVSS